MLFFANIYFWRQNNNYFAPGSETDPFLHTWSLAVEEQFYLFFPLVFLLLFFLGRRGLIVGTILSALGSFVLMLLAYDIAPTATFFLPLTRAWEFLAGSLLALGALPKLARTSANNALTALGIALLIASTFLIDSTMAFPNWVTLAPVLGTVLIIQYGEAIRGPVSLLLTSSLPVGIGKISYSLYLWHWPIFVFAQHYWLYRELTSFESILGILVSIAVAYLSYRFVEQPFRTGASLRAPARLLAVALPMVLVAVSLAWIFDRSQGLNWRYPDFANVSIDPQRAEEQQDRQAARSDCFLTRLEGRAVDGCHLTAMSTQNTMILGDSFGQHYLAALSLSSPPEGRGLISFTSPQCPPIIGYDPVNLPSCRIINERALDMIAQMNVDTVILAANWFNYITVNRISFEDVSATIDALRAQELQVVMVGQSPVFGFTSPEEAYYTRRVPDNDAATAPNGVSDDFRASLLEASRTADLYFDPTDVLCDRQLCTLHDGDKYTVSDYGHLTTHGAQILIDRLLADMQRTIWN